MELLVALEPEAGADPEETDRLGRSLRRELRSLDVDDVSPVPAGAAPHGSKGVDAASATELAGRLRELVETSEAHAGERDVIARYRAAIEAEAAVADRERWADGRTFSFERVLTAPPDTVWRYWVDPDALASWWAPPPMTIAECVLEPRRGGRAVLDYRDAEGRRYRSEGRVHTAAASEHLEFDLSVLDEAGAVSFTGHYDLALAATPDGTRLRLDLRITETTVEAVPFIAGIETGWGQVLDKLADTVGQHSTKEGTARS